MKSIAKKIFTFVALLALFIAPSQWCVSVAGVRVTPADLLLPIAFASAFATRGWRMLVPPLENAVFLVLAALSAAFGADKGEGIKEFIQLVLYFYVAERTFSALLCSGGKNVRRAILTFLAAGGISIAVAAIQYFQPDSTAFPLCLRPGLSVRGMFGNNNVLCGYLAMMLPFAFALITSKGCIQDCRGTSNASDIRDTSDNAGCPFSHPSHLSHRACIACKCMLGLMVLAGFFVMFSGAAFVAVAFALSVIAFRRHVMAGFACAAMITVLFFYVMPLLPRDNFTSLVQSAEIYHSVPGEVKYSDDGILTWNAGEPTRRYPEWQAALTMSFERPLIGIGPGTYQKNVGPYFDMIPRATGPCEPDIQNMYLVMASTMGYPVLIAFLLMLCGAVRGGWNGNAVSIAATFAIAAFAAAAIWHPLLVRGIGIPLVFMLSLARRDGMV